MGMWDQGLFERALAAKYSALQQNADATTQNANTSQYNAETQRLGMNASVNLDNIRAGLLPGQAKSEEALQAAEAANYGATSKSTLAMIPWLGQEAKARIGLYGAQAKNFNADAGLTNQNVGLQSGYNLGAPSAGGLGITSDALRQIIYSRLGLPQPAQ